MKQWFYKCYGPFVGCEETGIIDAETEDEAYDAAYDIAVTNYHSYAFGTDDEEDVEPEYDYYVEPYDPEKHDPQI